MATFNDIYEAYSMRVYRFLLSLSQDAQMAEELTQEVFYRALLHIHDFKGRSALITWLCEIGKNAWLAECRRNNRFNGRSLEEVHTLATDPGLDQQLIQQEAIRALRREIATLREDYRDVIILHTYGELTLKEIAALYEKSESWAKVTYYRAKKILAEKLEVYR